MSAPADVFTASAVYDAPPEVTLTSCASFGDELVVGTTEGHLLHLVPSSEPGGRPLTVKRKVPASESRQRVVQLAAAASSGVLVVLLADGTLSTHELPSLRPGDAVARAVGCSAFALLRCASDGAPRLAAVCNNELRLYRWRAASDDAAGTPGMHSLMCCYNGVVHVPGDTVDN